MILPWSATTDLILGATADRGVVVLASTTATTTATTDILLPTGAAARAPKKTLMHHACPWQASLCACNQSLPTRAIQTGQGAALAPGTQGVLVPQASHVAPPFFCLQLSADLMYGHRRPASGLLARCAGALAATTATRLLEALQFLKERCNNLWQLHRLILMMTHLTTFPPQLTFMLQDDSSIQVIFFSMPCARCGSWEEFPSWHPCEDACANAQGTATLHTGEEIRCNKSWDGTWWFFFCNTCKQTRPHIRGVLRGARIYLRMEHTDYITDSENSSYYCSSEGESCTQEEAE